MITVQTKPRTQLKLRDKYQRVPSESEVLFLEKAEEAVETFGGATTLENITDALDEFDRLFRAGVASDAEILTLARAFPDNPTYTTAAIEIPEESVMVVGGPASVELIDREGHLITTGALREAFKKYMESFRTRNAMVLHSDVQVGWALPAYITRGGQVYKSDVNDKGLFFICEIRNDTKIADRVRDQIKDGKLKSYSIAGSATKVQNMTKGLMPYMQVDEMELAEVTVCEKGVNQGASFELLKAEMDEQTGKISKEQCGYREATPAELNANIACGSCIYFNEQENSCETVSGHIEADDFCLLYKPEEDSPDTMDTEEKDGIAIEIHLSKRDDGSINFTRSFLDLIKTGKDELSDEEKERLLERLGHTFGSFNPADGDEEGTIFDSTIMEPYTGQGKTGTPNDPIPDPRPKQKGDGEYNNLESFQNFIKGIKSDASSASTVDVATTNMDDGKVGISPNTIRMPLLDPSKNRIMTDSEVAIASPKPDIIPGSTKLGVASFKDSKGNVIKIFKDILAQQQWTIDEEPPSFNWGPYGFQNKSNLG